MICASQSPDERVRLREAGVQSPGRDGLLRQTQILDQRRGEGSGGRTRTAHRGQSRRERSEEMKGTSRKT